VNLIPRRQIGDRRLLSQRFHSDLCLQRRINLPARLRRHHSFRLSQQNGAFPTNLNFLWTFPPRHWNNIENRRFSTESVAM